MSRNSVKGGELVGCDMVAVSSGSTGEPTFWPRSMADEFTMATRFEQAFRDSFHADQRTTMAVVCFALGTWVGGMYTASCCPLPQVSLHPAGDPEYFPPGVKHRYFR